VGKEDAPYMQDWIKSANRVMFALSGQPCDDQIVRHSIKRSIYAATIPFQFKDASLLFHI